jgi:hypothetical protein
MTEFRAYRIGDDGLIVDRFDLDCADESQARAMAEERAIDHGVELWERTRRIAVYKSQKHRMGRGAG